MSALTERPRKRCVFVVLCTCLLLATTQSAADTFFEADRPLPLRVLSLAVHVVDFEYAGVDEPTTFVDLQITAYGARFDFPHGFIVATYGRQGGDPLVPGKEDLSVFDLEFTAHSMKNLRKSRATPVGVTGDLSIRWRRLGITSKRDTDRAAIHFLPMFIGAGLGASSRVGSRAQWSARAMGELGITITPKREEDSALRMPPISYGIRADVQLDIEQLLSERFGLTLGYSFRWERWTTNVNDLFPVSTQEDFDFDDVEHRLRVGINW